MAFSDAEKELIFQLYGVPRSGSASEITRIGDRFGPAYETYDCSTLVTLIEAAITAVNLQAARLAACQALLTEAAAITNYSELKVNVSNGSIGVLADDQERLANIRKDLFRLMGVYGPKGGFVEECRKRQSPGNRIPR